MVNPHNGVKKMKKFAIATMIVLFAMLFTGTAMAAFLPNETPETQSITTVTSVKCLGTVFESECVTVSSTSEVNPGEPPLVNTEVQSLASYVTSILAGNGYTEYDKSVEVDTSNKKNNEYNVKTSTSFEYSGHGAVFDESILEEGASTGDKDKGKMVLCPFGKNEPAAAFCNRAMATTNFMGDAVDIVSSSGTRTIAKTYDVGPTLDYGVSAVGDGAITITFDTVDMDSRTAQTTEKKLVPSVFVPDLVLYDPSGYTASGMEYTPSSYSPEYWTTGKCCIPKLVPSEYTPEDVSYNPSAYTPESLIVIPGKYVPEHYITVGKTAQPSAITEYHERTTAIGQFDVTKVVSYKSSL